MQHVSMNFADKRSEKGAGQRGQVGQFSHERGEKRKQASREKRERERERARESEREREREGGRAGSFCSCMRRDGPH